MNTSVIRLLRYVSFAVLLIALNCGATYAQEDASSSSAADLNKEMQADLERQVSLPLPETTDKQEQCVFFHKRGMANYRLGRYDQAISDLNQALALNQPSRLTPENWGDRWRIQEDLKNALSSFGNYFALLEYLDTLSAEQLPINSRRYFIVQSWKINTFVSLGMLKEAEDAYRIATELLPGLKTRRDWDTNEYAVLANYSTTSGLLQELRGNSVEAERYRRAALDNAKKWLDVILRMNGRDSQLVRVAKSNLTTKTRQLSSLLSTQGKLGEAEYLAHEALTQTLARSSFNTVATSHALSALRRIKLQQGQLDEAGRYAELALQAIEKASVQPYSWTLADRRGQVGLIHVIQGRWNEALKVYDLRDQGLRSNPEQFAKRSSADLNWALALLRTGQGQKASEMLQRNLDYNLKKPFVDPVYLAHIRGYLGVALSEQSNSSAALAQFKEALPILLKRAQETASDNDAGFISVYRLRIIIEGYLDLLAKLHESRQQVAGLDIVTEAFKIADIARNSSVQRAVTSSAARATLPDPQLAQLARREQDTSNQIQALNKVLARLASSPDGRRLQKVIDDMQRDIEKLAKEQLALRKELVEKFPGYAALIDPQPATPADLQKILNPDEAVVSIYSGERQSYVWTITKNEVGFRVVPVTLEQIARDVAKILQGMDLSGERTKEFDAVTAHRLYASLLAPDAGKWAKAGLINIIPHGALGQLPFALLLTDPVKPAIGKTQPAYAELPWLINKVAIAQQSSASGFLALRQSVPAKIERKPFIGFGDPLFMADAAPATQRGRRVRSLGITTAPDETLKLLERSQGSSRPLDHAILTSQPTLAQAFSQLPPLPDTAEELKDIAQTTGADEKSDLFLGTRATESNVKATDLSRYRVVAFATHGLVPGELSGLDQPALAMANPALTQDANNDGFLTLEEVLGLKLNAEWVVLSACNTGSADGIASEAVSGLGRAFFFAGTRSLLVSNWAVETVSARLLTTGLFRQQASNPGMFRAEALRNSMLAVMKDKSGNYTHPAFWAPFSLVGDGLVQ